MVLLLSSIFVVMSCILQGIDGLKNMRKGKKRNNLNSRKGIDIDSRVLNTDPLLVEVLSSTNTALAIEDQLRIKSKEKGMYLLWQDYCLNQQWMRAQKQTKERS